MSIEARSLLRAAGKPLMAFAGVAGALGLFCWIGNRFAPMGIVDPDRFFHLALARETVAEGRAWLARLPQVQGLGWDRSFPDKEFLFHLLNQFAYRLGGEPGVLLLLLGMGAAGIALLVWNMALFLNPIASLAVVSGFFFLDPYIMLRMTLLRPHVHALVWFQLFLGGLIRRNLPLAGAGLLLFALGYHTFYVPFLVLGLFYAAEVDWKGERLRIFVFGSIALLAGIVFNPYFPWNVWMSIRHLMIALFEAGDHQLDFGIELFPWTTDKFIFFYLPLLVAVLGIPFASLVGIRIPSYRLLARSTPLTWLWSSAAGFLLLATLNPRALEYAIPLSCLALAAAVHFIRERELLPWRAWGLLALVAVAAVPRAIEAIPLLANQPRVGEGIPDFLSGISSIPERDAVVFNVEWDNSPYIYYARPDLKWIDLLDPTFLKARDPRLHELRWALRQGGVGDPWGVLRARTGAVAVVTRNSKLSRQLRGDPHFERIFPAASHGLAAAGERGDEVIAMKKDRDPHFVLQWQGAEIYDGSSIPEVSELSPASIPRLRRRLKPLQTRFTERFLGDDVEGGQGEGAAKPVERKYVLSAMLNLALEWGSARGNADDGVYGKGPEKKSKKNAWELLNESSRRRPDEEGGEDSASDEVAPEIATASADQTARIGCYLVRPSFTDRKRQDGRTVIAIGGSRNIRVWLNGEKVFNSVVAKTGANLIDHLVRLDHPLSPSDQVEVIACSSMPSTVFSVALSFWTEDELTDVCLRKGWTPPEKSAPIEGWPFLGQYSDTCFGPYLPRHFSTAAVVPPAPAADAGAEPAQVQVQGP